MKALITLLILGSSSVAFARPVTVRDHRDAPLVSDGYTGNAIISGQVSVSGTLVRDHRHDAPVLQPLPPPAPQVRDHREPMTFSPPAPDADTMRARIQMRRPVMLATGATFIHDHHDHSSKPMYISFERMGGFKKLRID